ncbi:MAG: TonB-dependent receptor plug domain-containing protein [Bacteroidales bacterium]|nr:TonB-dependent receptor plug domain-containing protein [Bacteroidales bacterium]
MKNSLVFTLLFLFTGVMTVAQEDTTKISDEDVSLPVFDISVSELESLEEAQDISTILQSSEDIFARKAGYTFGSARFRVRGYDSKNTTVTINGVPMNDLESGRAYWASWGGLNDAMRDQDVNIGLSYSDHTFSGIGGFTNINTRASDYGRGVKATYSAANRSYRNRIMVTAATGQMDNGWSIAASGSRRWAEEGYVEGSFYDAFSYFLSAEKKINDQHSVGFIGFGAPNRRGKSGVSTNEAYELAGSNYYNSYWGYQDGKKRNARIGNYHQPMFMLSHYWDLNEKSNLTTTVSHQSGRGGSTALNWLYVDDPRPDYYRNLPSYYELYNNPEEANRITRLWNNNESYRQLNWDHFYFANSKFLQTTEDVDGIEGNDVTYNRSKYIVEDRRHDKSEFGFNSAYQSKINDHITFTSGLDLSWFKGMHFKEVVDLLGGEYWLDINKFAEREPNIITDVSQSDLNNPNRLVTEGDVFGYDYNSNINKYLAYAGAEFTYKNFDYYAKATVSFTEFWRTGNMKNGQFPEESYGDSEKQTFTNYGIRGGVTYKIDGRNFLEANANFMTRAPYFRDSYVSPRTRDHAIDNLESETIYSGDFSYLIRAPFLRSRLTFYYTRFLDQVWARSFYHDNLNTFVNYLMTDVDKESAGMELGVEGDITNTITLGGVLGLGEIIYTNRPKVTIAQDNDSEILAENRTVYLKDYYVGGGPQSIASFNFKYDSPKYWFVQVSYDYMDDIYLDINPEKRTTAAVSRFYKGDTRVDKVLEQEKLPGNGTINLFGGKSWKFGDYYLSFIVSVNNILDRTDIPTGGFEQLRYDEEFVEKFQPRYFYWYGRNYFINLSFRF